MVASHEPASQPILSLANFSRWKNSLCDAIEFKGYSDSGGMKRFDWRCRFFRSRPALSLFLFRLCSHVHGQVGFSRAEPTPTPSIVVLLLP